MPDGRRLFDIFRGPHWTVLEFGETAVDFGIPRVHLSPGPDYDVPAGSYVLVRPDGHVAAITDQPEVIREQLRRFSPVRAASWS
ncbi:putative FAD-binding monooxygenase [Mycobacteroides abscessus subsp. abscessus]|nr:putative FAD-binding monooxygenase [Mycobacteroides abscessus subsp. abscessus]